MSDRRRPNRRRPPRAALLGALVLSLAASCAIPGPALPDIAPEINATLDATPLRLMPGDRLEVRFAYVPERNHETLVGPDGRASFLELDDIPVAGLPLAALDARLERAYAATLTQPELTVFVTEPATRAVTVLGEVAKPGIQELSGRLSLVEALGRAGGPRFSSRLDQMVLVRWVPELGKRLAWKIDARRRHWGSPEPILLQAGDVLYLPHKRVINVNVFVDQYIRKMIPFPQFVPTA